MPSSTTAYDLTQYSMNIDPRYVEDWGAYETGREIHANGVDADPDGFIEEVIGNKYTAYTRTCPTVEEVLCIGSGTKSKNDEATIGQFGEGLKLSALVACRTEDASLTVEATWGTVTYSLITPPNFKNAILHAHVDPDKQRDNGCLVTLIFPGVEAAMKSKFLDPNTRIGPVPKSENTPDTLSSTEGMNIYVKGIFVTRLDESSLYHWNLQTSSINRDRAIVDAGACLYEVGCYLASKLSIDWVKLLLKWQGFESAAFKRYDYVNSGTRHHILPAFQAVYGDDAVLADADHRINDYAYHAGKRPVPINADLMDIASFIAELPKAEDFKPKPRDLAAAAIPPEYKAAVQEIVDVMDLLDIPACIKLFDPSLCDDPSHIDVQAQAEYEEGDSTFTMWLSLKLFTDGSRKHRLGVAFHELSHFKSNMADDQTLQFEATLSSLGGKLASAWLDHQKTINVLHAAAQPKEPE